MAKPIGGTLAGVLVAMLAIIAGEMAAHALFPPPPGADFATAAGLRAAMALMPVGLKATVLSGWGLGTLLGGLLAIRIARRAAAAGAVAAVVVAAAIWNMIIIPHPLWMQAGGIALPFAAAWVATRLRPAPPLWSAPQLPELRLESRGVALREVPRLLGPAILLQPAL